MTSREVAGIVVVAASCVFGFSLFILSLLLVRCQLSRWALVRRMKAFDYSLWVSLGRPAGLLPFGLRSTIFSAANLSMWLEQRIEETKSEEVTAQARKTLQCHEEAVGWAWKCLWLFLALLALLLVNVVDW